MPNADCPNTASVILARSGLRAARRWLMASACSGVSSRERYFGKVEPPEGQVLRYVTGGEPESLDPQLGTGQPESRIYVALFDGLTDYEPKTGDVAPGLADRWEVTESNTVFVFHMRPGALWSDGRPITAHDFVYTMRRGLSPAFASPNAYMAYDILYARAYNEGALFARDPRSGQFVDDPDAPTRQLVASGRRRGARHGADAGASRSAPRQGARSGPRRRHRRGCRWTTTPSASGRRSRFHSWPRLLAHQFFRLVPRRAVERYGDAWTKPEHLIASGPFMLDTWRPYDRIVVVRNPRYWDAGRFGSSASPSMRSRTRRR